MLELGAIVLLVFAVWAVVAAGMMLLKLLLTLLLLPLRLILTVLLLPLLMLKVVIRFVFRATRRPAIAA
jgi:hypothetical protein